MTTFAEQCTRIYSPGGAVAHLAAPGTARPLCPVATQPKGGWRGTFGGLAGERERAASLPTCKHCERIAAAAKPVSPSSPLLPSAGAAAGDAAEAARSLPFPGSGGQAADEQPAGGATAEASAPPAGASEGPMTGEALEPLPVPGQDQPALRGPEFLRRWKSALAAGRAGQRGDRGRRARRGRGQDPGPGMHRRGGTT